MALTALTAELEGRLRQAELTYGEIGQTAGLLPPGYHHLRRYAVIGSGAEALSLSAPRHSHALARLAVLEAARGSFEAAHAAITGRCGPVMGKRQVEQAVGERRQGHHRLLRRPHPRALHCLDAAGDLSRRQGDRDAARGAAGGRRQGRRPPGQEVDPVLAPVLPVRDELEVPAIQRMERVRYPHPAVSIICIGCS